MIRVLHEDGIHVSMAGYATERAKPLPLQWSILGTCLEHITACPPFPCVQKAGLWGAGVRELWSQNVARSKSRARNWELPINLSYREPQKLGLAASAPLLSCI